MHMGVVMFDRENEYEQKELRGRELWDQLVALEPQLTSELERLHAGMICLDDLWDAYFRIFLHWKVGPHRLLDGDPILFTEDAFYAALDTLYEESEKWHAQYPTGEAPANPVDAR